MKDPEKLKELILEEIDFSQVLLDYNVDFVYSPELVDEAQLRCPFHGQDNKPSARYYRETQSMFCWVCHKRWDVIGFIMEMEQVYYKSALLYIVNKYQLDVSSIPDDPTFNLEKKKGISKVTVDTINAKKSIKGLRFKISFERYRALVAAYYMIMFKSSKGGDILSDIQKLNSKLNTIQIG